MQQGSETRPSVLRNTCPYLHPRSRERRPKYKVRKDGGEIWFQSAWRRLSSIQRLRARGKQRHADASQDPEVRKRNAERRRIYDENRKTKYSERRRELNQAKHDWQRRQESKARMERQRRNREAERKRAREWYAKNRTKYLADEKRRRYARDPTKGIFTLIVGLKRGTVSLDEVNRRLDSASLRLDEINRSRSASEPRNTKARGPATD